jgi:hypothetical protein
MSRIIVIDPIKTKRPKEELRNLMKLLISSLSAVSDLFSILLDLKEL